MYELYPKLAIIEYWACSDEGISAYSRTIKLTEGSSYTLHAHGLALIHIGTHDQVAMSDNQGLENLSAGVWPHCLIWTGEQLLSLFLFQP